MDTTAGIVSLVAGRLGCVQADAHSRREAVLAPVGSEVALDVTSACDGGIRVFEGDKEAIAFVLYLLAAMVGERGAEETIVPTEQVVPRVVADASRSFDESTMSVNMYVRVTRSVTAG